MWATADKFYSSMKWHIADSASVEAYLKPHPWKPDKIELKYKATIMCGKNPKPFFLGEAKIRKTINIYQANVCAYCRNKILEDEGLESRLLK